MTAPVRCTEQPADLRDFCIRTLAALIRQGGGAIKPEVGRSMCLYRHGTRACAVGMWIPDDEYSIELEGDITSQRFLQLRTVLPVDHPINQFTPALRVMQIVHDRAAIDVVNFRGNWLGNLCHYWMQTSWFHHGQREVIWSLACELADSGATL